MLDTGVVFKEVVFKDALLHYSQMQVNNSAHWALQKHQEFLG